VTRRTRPSLQRVLNRHAGSRCIPFSKEKGERSILRTEASNTDFNVRAIQHACFTLTSLVACHREIRHLAAQALNATRLLQSAIPILAEFVAPLLISPD